MDKYVNASELLTFALRIEENGGKFYNYAVTMVGDEKIRRQLVALSGWEAGHVAHIKSLMKTISNETDEIAMEFIADDDAARYVTSLADDHIFIRNEGVDDIIKEATTISEILELALHFEKDSVRFYRSLETKLVDEVAKVAISKIAAEEEQHVEQILKLIRDHGE